MKKLNPFAFPSETSARFSLLVFGAAIVVGSLALVTLGKLTLNSLISVSFRVDADFIRNADLNMAYLYLCSAPVVIAASLGALFGVAYFTYHRHPKQIQHSKDLKALDSTRDQNFLAALRGLAQRADIPSFPEIYLGPPGAQDGQAFGFRSHPMLRLGPGLKVMRIKENFAAQFRAVVLHELGHIKNDDVQRSYFAEAIWKALLLLTPPLVCAISLTTIYVYFNLGERSVLSPFFVLFLVVIPFALLVLIELGLIVWVVHYIRRGMLRVREIYADWRAAQWGALDGLTSILSAAKQDSLPFWKRLMRVHPKPEDRLRALNDPGELFRLTFDLPLFTGFLLGFAFSGIGPLFGLFSIFRLVPLGSELFSTLGLSSIAFFLTLALPTFLWLLASAVGLQIQREAAADLSKGMGGLYPYLRLFPPAILLHIGFEAGVYLMPFENIQVDPLSMEIGATLAFPFWILGISSMTWLWMSAIRFFTRRWIGAHGGPGSPIAKIQTMTILSIPTLFSFYVPFALTRGWPAVSENMLLPAFLVLLAMGFLFSLSCLMGWLLLSVLSPLPKCHRCGAVHSVRQTIGQVCAKCGTNLAEWLYVT
ncbi:MAG: M48 family metalloprotease [Chloroflexi bacterium]|nr:M48 family metalloprotease [Chloroflexota bacterium]